MQFPDLITYKTRNIQASNITTSCMSCRADTSSCGFAGEYEPKFKSAYGTDKLSVCTRILIIVCIRNVEVFRVHP